MVQDRPQCSCKSWCSLCHRLSYRSFYSFQIIDGMHLTKQSRGFVSNFCRDSVYHHLLVEFDCDEKCIDENIKETAMFYQKLDGNTNWVQSFYDKNAKLTPKYEKCTVLEGPLISVNNSENPMIHSVTARGVQGLLQTLILGVLSSPSIKHRVFYFSRHGESEFNVLGESSSKVNAFVYTRRLCGS